MMKPRSTVAFRSNIYPTSTRGDLANDRKFLDAISDPEALDILWRYGGSRGSKLNLLQKRQHDMAAHCMYAEEGDYPWGTPVGSDHVVCLCDRTDCPRYLVECSKFHPEGFVPLPREDRRETPPAARSKTVTKQKTAKKPAKVVRPTTNASATVTSTMRSSMVSQPPRTSQTNRPPAPSRLGSWRTHEDDILREMYPLFGMSLRKWTKPLPGRSAGEILDRAHELKVRYVPQREREVSRERTAKRGAVKSKPRPVKSGDGMSRAEKEKHREQMRKRPWEPREDAIIRNNYPTHGAEMKDWSQKLQYRTKVAIEARAKQLGL